MESECEQAVLDFLIEARGEVAYPLSTDDLTLIVERYADLDLYADLRVEGEDVQGLTSFASGRRPSVRVDERLSTNPRRGNRLRTTLAHEFGHVRLHNILFQEEAKAVPLFGKFLTGEQKCRRDAIARPSRSDWLEFQAGYVSTALLAPKRRVVEVIARSNPEQAPLVGGNGVTERVVQAISSAFEISEEAARVRLRAVGAAESAGQARLF
jgi:hypothetical protein